MLIIAGFIRVPQAVKAELQPHLEAYVAAVRAEPGCRAFTFAYDAVEPELMRIFEVYDDAAAFAAHDGAAYVKAWRATREGLGVTDRNLVRYEVASSAPL
jgi:quinol monooxygenase YgiN